MSVADIISFLMVVVAVIGVFISRRKTNADIASQVTAMALSLIEPLEKRIQTLEEEKEKLRAEMDEINQKNAELRNRIQSLDDEISKLMKENISLKKRVDDLECENRALLDERETLQGRVKTLETELSRMRGKNE